MAGWLLKKVFSVVERDKEVKRSSFHRGVGRENSSSNSLPTFTRASFLLHLRFSLFNLPPLFSRRKAKKRMYLSSIHCAVVMATIVLDNLPPPRTCSPLYQATLFLISMESSPAINFIS